MTDIAEFQERYRRGLVTIEKNIDDLFSDLMRFSDDLPPEKLKHFEALGFLEAIGALVLNQLDDLSPSPAIPRIPAANAAASFSPAQPHTLSNTSHNARGDQT